jgi:hypothetical protein
MKEFKCQTCIYGAILIENDTSIFQFKEAIRKENSNIITINYKNNESGCRMSDWKQKQEECLSNNYKNYKKGDLWKN